MFIHFHFHCDISGGYRWRTSQRCPHVTQLWSSDIPYVLYVYVNTYVSFFYIQLIYLYIYIYIQTNMCVYRSLMLFSIPVSHFTAPHVYSIYALRIAVNREAKGGSPLKSSYNMTPAFHLKHLHIFDHWMGDLEDLEVSSSSWRFWKIAGWADCEWENSSVFV